MSEDSWEARMAKRAEERCDFEESIAEQLFGESKLLESTFEGGELSGTRIYRTPSRRWQGRYWRMIHALRLTRIANIVVRYRRKREFQRQTTTSIDKVTIPESSVRYDDRPHSFGNLAKKLMGKDTAVRWSITVPPKANYFYTHLLCTNWVRMQIERRPDGTLLVSVSNSTPNEPATFWIDEIGGESE